jgi:hypothetical protein
MVYVIGRTRGGAFSQLLTDHLAADRWQQVMERVSGGPVVWERHEVEATSIVEAVAEISRQM